MKRIALWPLAVLFFAGAAEASPSVKTDRASSSFRLLATELSVSVYEIPATLSGLTAHAAAINENGQVAGWSLTSSNQTHAFFWSPDNPTQMQDLDPTGGGNLMMAFGMNDNGIVVGWRLNFSSQMEGFIWYGGNRVYLGANTVAFDVNNANKVVGAANTGSGFKAAVWTIDPSTMRVSGPTFLLSSSGPISVARAINEFGDVAGWYFTSSSEIHGFVKKNGETMQDVDVAFGNFSDAYGLNGAAWAVGETGYSSGGDRHAFLWGSAILDLEQVDGTMSIAYGLDADGLAVGRSDANPDKADRAMLWGASGLRMDLGSAGGTSLDAATARAINGKRQVAGFSTNRDGLTRATIWTLTEVTAPPPPPPPPPPPAEEMTAVQKIDRLIAIVEGNSYLNRGQATSLIMKLKAARRQVVRQNERAAANIIRAFTLQVHGFLRGGIMDDAEDLLKAAGGILP